MPRLWLVGVAEGLCLNNESAGRFGMKGMKFGRSLTIHARANLISIHAIALHVGPEHSNSQICRGRDSSPHSRSGRGPRTVSHRSYFVIEFHRLKQSLGWTCACDVLCTIVVAFFFLCLSMSIDRLLHYPSYHPLTFPQSCSPCPAPSAHNPFPCRTMER